MEDINELRRRLQEAERRAEAAEAVRIASTRRAEAAEAANTASTRRAEIAEAARIASMRRAEAAEAAYTAWQPKGLQQFLESYHSLYLDMQVVTERSLTTQGATTNPTGRIFPRRIIPWDEFAIRQEEIWNELAISDLLSKPAFPSSLQVEHERSKLKPISSEVGLRLFASNVIDDAVQRLVDRTHADPLLRNNLGLQGTITFWSHANLSAVDSMSTPMGQITPPAPNARRRARGKGNRADQFCIYRTSEGQDAPTLAIEYKAPHKLSIDEITTGLQGEIQPERDVINKTGQGFAFTARRLAAAAITQLFSYMIGKGLQYGYICTGEAFIFLNIPDDPTKVYFSVCVPSLDVMDDDETRLHRTAVAQVSAFVLQSLRARPPPETWHDEAETLGIWAVEYEDILRDIPPAERKRKQPHASPYTAQRWEGFQRSPIRTRSRCKKLNTNANRREDQNKDPPSPTPNPSRAGRKTFSSVDTSVDNQNQGRRSGQQQKESGEAKDSDIQSRPFCTQRCLLELANGGPIDRNCPNASYHGQEHISRLEFLRLVRHQLAIDRGRDADCAPLHKTGSRGSLFKVRLTSHGYTLVAKGVEGLDLGCLEHENNIYNRLQPIQGSHVPVCLGTINLVLPYYYNSGVYVHFMFLSWAGQPVFDCIKPAMKASVRNAVSKAFRAIHNLGVLHRDAEPRNILYNTTSRELLIVDFERSALHDRQPLASIGPNKDGKSKRRGSRKQTRDDFVGELEHVVARVSSCFARLPSPATIKTQT